MNKLTGILVSLVLLFSCDGSPAPKGESRQSEKTTGETLTLAVLPTLDCLPIFYAESMGINDSLGLSLRLTTYRSQWDCDTALQRKHADVVYSDLARAQYHRARGTRLQFLFGTTNRAGMVASKVLRVTKVPQMDERVLAVERFSMLDLNGEEALQEGKIAYDHVLRAQINDLLLRTRMLDENQIDAAMLPEPYLSLAKSNGHRILYTTTDKRPLAGGFVALEQTVNDGKKDAQLRTLVKAYNLAVAALNKKENQSAARRLMAEKMGISQDGMDTLNIPVFKMAELPEDRLFEATRAYLQRRVAIGKGYSFGGMTTTKYLR